jgi:hypothetical protein
MTEKMQPTTPLDAALLRSLFDRIYVINLPERADRRKEVLGELHRVGVQPDDPFITFWQAVRPADRGEFRSIGARGCFLSHLGVLEDAVAQGLQSILIIEDDMDWTALALSPEFDAAPLKEVAWHFVHGGLGERAPDLKVRMRLHPIPPEENMMLSHFIALREPAIGAAVQYLSAMLQRPAGSPDGGPMDVDGAYSWFRKDHPEFASYVCEPSIAMQRSSRSDITDATGWRATWLADAARRLRRAVLSRRRD